MPIEVHGGIAWEKVPAVKRNDMIKDGDAWYAFGVERVETPGTAGWRATQGQRYLQEDGTWDKKVRYFPTEEAAKEILDKALRHIKSPDANEISAFELALRAAREAKERKKK